MQIVKEHTLKLAAAISTFALTAGFAMPARADGLGDMVDALFDNLEGIPDLLSLIAYIAGAALGIAGIMKLKQHVDAPQQMPLKNGLMFLAAGAALLALPFILEALIETVGGDTDTTIGASRFEFN
ncbi:MAG: DUF6750 family protein [Pseudomonadota bacterium]|nr:DUF6750 family protein [Pseudomonadota bacterium]